MKTHSIAVLFVVVRFILLYFLAIFCFTSVLYGQAYWSVSYLPADGMVGALAVNVQGHIFASQSDATWRTTDEGRTWLQIAVGFPLWQQDVAVNNRGRVFFSGGGGVYYSDDNGLTFTPHISGIPESDISNLIISKNDHVFAGSGPTGSSVFRSTDSGESWQKVFAFFNTGDVEVHYNPKTETLLVRGARGGDSLYRSTDNGDSWHYVPYPVSMRIALRFASDSVGYVYCTAGEQTGHKSAYRSSDDGLTWEKMPMVGAWNEGSTWRNILVNSLGHIFFGTDGNHVYRSIDSGQTAEKLYQGMDHSYIDGLALLPDGRLLAGSRRRLFISLKSTTNTEPVLLPQELSLSQNYPNPAHELTSVSFSLPQAGAVSLTLYNALGAQVQRIIEGDHLPPGEHGATLDVSTLPAGVYVLRLHVAGRVVSRMVLVE